MSFTHTFGGELSRELVSSVRSGRLPHAVILEGDTVRCQDAARFLAKARVCSGTGEKPCGVCPDCTKAEKDIHPDIATVEILDKKQAIGVGEVRSVISDCYVKPNEASCKVYRIFDKMTPEAQNALLKILEEPPQDVMFIICAQSTTSLLPTVISRCAVFRLADGDAEQNTQADETAQEIARAISDNMELKLLIATGKLANDKVLMAAVFDRLEVILNDALESRYVPNRELPPYTERIAATLRKRSIVKLIEVVGQARAMLARNCNMNLLATWFCANIRISRHTGES